jgi:hypothetical protein
MKFALPSGYAFDLIYYTTFPPLDEGETDTHKNRVEAIINTRPEGTEGSADVIGFVPHVEKHASGNDGEYVNFEIKADVSGAIKEWGHFFLTDLAAFWGYNNAEGCLYVQNIPENLVVTATTEKLKEGEYTPKKRISRIYLDNGNGKTLREIWRWNDNLLQSIDHYSSGSISWVEEFTYNDKNQIVRVEDFLNGETMEYEYNGSNISKAIFYDEGSIDIELSFKYTDNKISEIEYTEYDYKKRNNYHLISEGNSPLKMLLTEKVYQVFEKIVNNPANRSETGTIKLTWKDNNVSKMEIRSGSWENIVDYKHDDKSNPFRNYYNLYGPGELDYEIYSTFSVNNVTEERWIEKEDGDTYVYTIKYSYSYDDMFPTIKRISYQYDDGYTNSKVYYYEYE